jgi:endonuclease YncB( thermonuclease family)
MKKITILALALFASVASANPYNWKIVRVVNGDTVVFEAPFMPAPLKPQLSIRVLGVDTPEKAPRAQCEKEELAAIAASSFTKKLVAEAKQIQIELKEHDKYGGRVLGDVFIDGKRLSQLLIENGHARPYYGQKKESWCN